VSGGLQAKNTAASELVVGAPPIIGSRKGSPLQGELSGKTRYSGRRRRRTSEIPSVCRDGEFAKKTGISKMPEKR